MPTRRSRGYFQGGHTGGVAFWSGDVGPDPPDRVGPEKIPAQDFVAAHQEAYKAEGGGEL